MDTEITYKYKDGLHEDVKTGQISLDKSVFKNYVDSYSTNYDDDLTILSRRLFNCHLRASGDGQCRAFLKDIYLFSKDEDFEKTYLWLLKQDEIVEIIFEMY